MMKKLNYLLLGFLSCLLGMLLHEVGHYVAHRYVGHNPTLQLTGVNLQADPTKQFLDSVAQRFSKEISSGSTFQNDSLYYVTKEQLYEHQVFTTIAGPLVSLLLGIIGLCWLVVLKKKSFFNQGTYFLALGMALQWFRPIVNLFLIGLPYLLIGRKKIGGDEVAFDIYFGLPTGSFYLLFGVIAAILLYLLFTKIVPRQERNRTILGISLGGVVAFALSISPLGYLVIW